MPKNVLYKYKCKELLCNFTIRSDKWNEHCKKKHPTKYREGAEIRKEVIAVRQSNNSEWKKIRSKAEIETQLCSSSLTSDSPSTSVVNISIDANQETEPKAISDLRSDSLQSSTTLHHNIQDPSGSTSSTEKTIQGAAMAELVDENKDQMELEMDAEETFSSSTIELKADETEDLSCDPWDYASKKLSGEIINFLLAKRKDMGIKTDHKWKYQHLPDGTKQIRRWLVHSIKKQAIFCLDCLLFGSPHTTRGITSFAVEGYSDWHNVARDVEVHEKSEYHRASEISLIRWNTGQMRIDKKIVEQHNFWVNHHQKVVSVVIDCIRYLTQEMMGFRNSSNTKGKLYNLFCLLAKYDGDAQIYLEKLKEYQRKKQRLRVNFLAYSSVATLTTIMKKLVIEKICSRIAEGKYYSIIVDSTQDSSKMEATVLLIRYIEGLGDSLSTSPHPAPVERLIGIFTSAETSGNALCERTIALLRDNNLNIKNIIGQSYDGAGNMRGSAKGMKTLIEKECPMALYCWCHSHRFNLVIEKSVETCILTKNFFGILEELHTFMNGHRRHGLFVEILEKSKQKSSGFRRQRLKRVFTSRWTSKSSACVTLDSCYAELSECLDLIANDKTVSRETMTCASGLRMKLLTFEFIALLKINVTIFTLLAPATIMLQTKIIDFGSATDVIDNVLMKLEALRTEESWNQLKLKIIKMADDFDIKAEAKRIVHRKRFFDEINLDYQYPDTFEKLKIEVFYSMIDVLIIQIKERFNKGTLQLLKDMLIFRHENLLKDNYTQKASPLCQYYNLDANAIEKELGEFKSIYKMMEKDVDVSDLLPKIHPVVTPEEETEKTEPEDDYDDSDDEDTDDKSRPAELEFFILKGFIKPFRLLIQFSSFNNLTILYKILISLAVTSCSAERAFSKHKIIKNPLRSTMLDEWMAAMMVLASEKDVLDSITNHEIIDIFSRKSSVYSLLLKK